MMVNNIRSIASKNKLFYFGSILIILGIATFWRFYHLDYRSLWYDEIEVIKAAQKSSLIDVVIGARNHMSAPPIDYILRHFWISAGGIGDSWVRAYSGIWGIIAVLFTYVLGRKLSGSKTGLFAALILAVSTFNVHYSTEIKFYIVLVVFYQAVIYTWLIAEEKRSINGWLLFGIIGLIGVYTHPYVVFAIAFSALASIITNWRNLAGRKAWISAFPSIFVSAVIALLYTPWILWDFLQQDKGWAPPELSWEFLKTTFIEFIPGGLMIVVVIIVGILLAAGYHIRNHKISRLPLWLTLVVAPLIVFVLDKSGNYPYMDKQLIFVQPIIFLLAADGFTGLAEALTGKNWQKFVNLAVLGISIFVLVLTFPELKSEKDPASWEQNNFSNVLSALSVRKNNQYQILWATHSDIYADVIQWYIDRNQLTSEAEAIFPWWENRVLNIKDFQDLSKKYNHRPVWLFGDEIDRFFDELGIADQVTDLKIGNVRIYKLNDLSLLNYQLITTGQKVILDKNNELNQNILLMKQYTYRFSFHFDTPAALQEKIVVELDNQPISEDVIQKIGDPDPQITFYLSRFIPGTHNIRVYSKSNSPAHSSIIRADLFPIIKIGASTQPLQIDASQMELVGNTDLQSDSNLRTSAWEYTTGDVSTLPVWAVKPGLYLLAVQGSVFGPPPAILNVLLDGKKIGNLEYPNTWEVKEIYLIIQQPGFHAISLSFANDYSGSNGDRNLLIDYAEVTRIPAVTLNSQEFDIQSSDTDMGINQSNGKVSIDFWASEPGSFLAEFKADNPISTTNSTVKMDSNGVDILNLGEDNGLLRVGLRVDKIGLHKLVVNTRQSGLIFTNFSIKPAVLLDMPHTISIDRLSYPPENNLVNFGKPGIIRYTSGLVASAQVWFLEPGKYQVNLEAWNAAPGPVNLQVNLNGIPAGDVQFGRADLSFGTQSLALDISAAGLYSLDVFFTNDYSAPGIDRNAVLSSLQISGIKK